MSNLVIGVASTAPAYSLAATLGFIVVVNGVGVKAPAVLIVSFVPIFLVAFAYRYLNKADPDCGHDVRVDDARLRSLDRLDQRLGDLRRGRDRDGVALGDRRRSTRISSSTGTTAASSTCWIIVGSVVWIALMTWICYRGIELSAETQVVPAQRGDPHPRGLRDRRARQGLQRQRRCRLDARELRRGSTRSTCRSARSSTASCSGSSSTGAGTRGSPSTRSRETRRKGPGKAAVDLDDPARADLRRRLDGRAGLRRHEVPRRNSNDVLNAARQGRVRLALGQAADHRRADVGLGVDPDDDPADGADDAVDGEVGRDPDGVREDPPALPDADCLDARDGCALGRVDGCCSSASTRAQNVLGDSITALGFAVCFYYGFTGLACGWYFRQRAVQERARGSCSPGLRR